MVRSFYQFLQTYCNKDLVLQLPSIQLTSMRLFKFTLAQIRKEHILLTEWYISLQLSIKICSIYEFYHYLNNGIWLEKDIFRVGLIIESRGYQGTLTTWTTHFKISKNVVAYFTDESFCHLYDLSIYCHNSFF